MKVFVLTLKECVDYDDTITNFVYSSEEKAKNHLEAALKEAEEYAEQHEWEFYADETGFTSYPEGYYSENHSQGFYSEYEVR